MKIAVVVLNWNGKKLLEQFLPSIIKFSDNATIYLADNASTDDSIAFVENHFPTIKIIKNNTNFGFAKGYNEALKCVNENILALVNSDIEVTENWLQPIVQTFENEPQTAVIQPKILDFKNRLKFEYAGAAGGFIDKYGIPFCRGRIFDSIENDYGQYNDNCEIFWASGACFFIRKKVFNEMHGFDEGFFAHQEEIDLCWRIQNANYTIKYVSQSIVYHVGGATLAFSNPKKTFLNFRNSLLMLTKNLPKSSLLSVIFFRLILDGIAAVKFISEGKFLHSVAILKAHFSFYALFIKYYKKRRSQQSKKYFKTKSIIFEYYLKNGKVFENLI